MPGTGNIVEYMNIKLHEGRGHVCLAHCCMSKAWHIEGAQEIFIILINLFIYERKFQGKFVGNPSAWPLPPAGHSATLQVIHFFFFFFFFF